MRAGFKVKSITRFQINMDDDEQKGYTWEAGYAEGLEI